MAFYRYRGFAGDPTDLRIVGDVQFRSQKAAGNWRTWRGAGDSRMEGTWARAASAGMFFGTESEHFSVTSFYTPVSEDVVARAQANWDKLDDLISLGAPSAARAQARMDQIHNLMGVFVGQAESVNDSGGFGPSMSGSTPVLVGAYNAINGLLTTFANETWPDAVAELAAQTKQAAQAKAQAAQQTANAATTAAKKQQTQDAIAAANAAIAAAQHAKDEADAAAAAHQIALKTASEKHAATMQAMSLPLALGIGGTVLVAAFFALRGRKKHLSGYRRHRRSRR